jgi:hypothetical protein
MVTETGLEKQAEAAFHPKPYPLFIRAHPRHPREKISYSRSFASIRGLKKLLLFDHFA